MKIILSVLILMVAASPIMAKDLQIFDKEGKYQGSVNRKGHIFDKDGKYQGIIKGGRMYDEDGRQQGIIREKEEKR
jgi:hypothetical protein